MSMAPQELEDSASRYATDAIRQDSQGARDGRFLTIKLYYKL